MLFTILIAIQLVCLVIPLTLVAQDFNGRLTRIDSLERIHTNDSNVQHKIFRKLVYEYLDFNNEIALQYANKAFDLSINMSDSVLIASSARLQAILLKKVGKISESIQKSEYAYSIAVRNNLTDELSEVYISLPIPHIFNANYDKALHILFESIEFFDKHRYLEHKSYALNNIGLVFFRMENYKKALDYFTQSFTLFKKLNVDYDEIRVLTNIAQCHSNLNSHEKAIEFIELGLLTCKSSCTTSSKIAAFTALGVAHYGLNRLKTSEQYFRKACMLSRIDNNQDAEAYTVLYLGMIAMKTMQYQAAENYLLTAEKIQVKNLETLLSIYKELINLYTITFSPNLAVYQARYIELKSKIYSATLVEKIVYLQGRQAEEANKLKVKQQAEILTLTERLVNRRYFMVSSIVGVSVILLILTVSLIWINIEKKRSILGLEKRVEQYTNELQVRYKALGSDHAAQSARFDENSNQVNQYIRSLIGFRSLKKDRNLVLQDKLETIIAKIDNT